MQNVDTFPTYDDRKQHSHLEEEGVGGRDLVLHGDDGMGEGEDSAGDAFRLLLHQLLLLLALLLQGGQPGLLLPLQELPQLPQLGFDLRLRGLGLVLDESHMETSSSICLVVELSGS